MIGNYQEVSKDNSATKNTTIVFVALYFLLLAFFIYLNSVSEPAEERIRSVIGSIDVAFKGEDVTPIKEDQIPKTSEQLGNARFHAELKDVFESAIPLVESQENEKGDQIQFKISLPQLFANSDVAFRDNREELFQRTAKALIKRSSIVPTDMEILIDPSTELPSTDSVRGDLSIKRLSNLVEYFETSGVPTRSMFIGLAETGSKHIYFKFYVRSSFDNQFRKETSQ